MDRWLMKRRVAHSLENWGAGNERKEDHVSVGTHLKDAQGSEVLLRWFSPGVIEQVHGGDNDGGIATRLALHEPRSLAQSVKSRTFRDAQVWISMGLDPSHP